MSGEMGVFAVGDDARNGDIADLREPSGSGLAGDNATASQSKRAHAVGLAGRSIHCHLEGMGVFAPDALDEGREILRVKGGIERAVDLEVGGHAGQHGSHQRTQTIEDVLVGTDAQEDNLFPSVQEKADFPTQFFYY
jgi:hypothetical protein